MLNYTCRTDGLRIRVLIILCDETSQPNQDNVNHDFYFLLVFWWMMGVKEFWEENLINTKKKKKIAKWL